MNVSNSFPDKYQVRAAYREVLETNVQLEQEAKDLADLEAQFGAPSEETQQLLDELEPDELVEQENKAVEKLETTHRELFEQVGLALGVSGKLHGSVSTPEHIVVPELEVPHQFAGYLGHLGLEAIYGDPMHQQLAQDVLGRIYNLVRHSEAVVGLLQRTPGSDPNAGHVIKEFRAGYLEKFSMIRPVYLEANFHLFTPIFRKLEERLPPGFAD
jgi:hypothetical protein